MRCLSKKNAICGAYGDPHVYTFDGASNSIYGVGKYVFSTFEAKTSESTESPNWKIIMETSPVGRSGRVSNFKAFTLSVKAPSYTYEVRTIGGTATFAYNFTDYSVANDAEFISFIGLHRGHRRVTYTTEFGLEVVTTGRSGRIFVPFIFSDKLKGICGDYDFNKFNDYACPDGTVHPFNKNSEYIAAKCWQVSGTPGDPPIDIERTPCSVASVCDSLFDHQVFEFCKKYIDTSSFITECKTDYCQVQTADTLTAIQEAFMEKCSTGYPTDNGVCNWRSAIGQNQCPPNSAWSGCKPQCQAQKTCKGSGRCSDAVRVEGCFCKAGFVLSDNGECISTTQCGPIHWESWRPCSVSCGGGTRTRYGYEAAERTKSEIRVCNTDECSPNIHSMPSCKCPGNSWTCQSTCETGYSCQRISTSSRNINRCIKITTGKCVASGDPHVYTFDGAQNDVYGVAKYIFTQYNNSLTDSDVPKFTVFMDTWPSGRVSVLRGFELTVETESYEYEVKTDNQKTNFVEYSYKFNDNSVKTDKDFERFIGLRQSGSGATLTTEFGLAINQQGYFGEVFVPYVFRGRLEGLCGNFDFNKTNDFMCPDGRVLPFDAGRSIAVSPSEFETAKCWLVSGEVGPGPDDIGTDTCEENELCRNLFTDPVFAKCLQVIDSVPYEEACKMDTCQADKQSDKENFVKDIHSQFMKKCGEKIPGDETVCTWKTELAGQRTWAKLYSSSCSSSSGKVWFGCRPQCQAVKTCHGTRSCDDKILVEGCFCKDGYVLSDNNTCIKPSSCQAHWEGWSSCSKSCGTGTRTRVGYKEIFL